MKLHQSVKAALDSALEALQDSNGMLECHSVYDEEGAVTEQIRENRAAIDLIVAVKCETR